MDENPYKSPESVEEKKPARQQRPARNTNSLRDLLAAVIMLPGFWAAPLGVTAVVLGTLEVSVGSYIRSASIGIVVGLCMIGAGILLIVLGARISNPFSNPFKWLHW